MKTNTIVKLVIWFIVFMAVLTAGTSMWSAANTIENIIGFVIVIAAVVITVKTKCFTTISINFKKKENNEK